MERIKNLATKLKDVFTLPSQEELLNNFPHESGCDQLVDLEVIEEFRYIISSVGAWGIGINGYIPFEYVSCGDCGVKKGFKES